MENQTTTLKKKKTHRKRSQSMVSLEENLEHKIADKERKIEGLYQICWLLYDMNHSIDHHFFYFYEFSAKCKVARQILLCSSS